MAELRKQDLKSLEAPVVVAFNYSHRLISLYCYLQDTKFDKLLSKQILQQLELVIKTNKIFYDVIVYRCFGEWLAFASANICAMEHGATENYRALTCYPAPLRQQSVER